MPEDRSKILSLLKTYKDKQTLNILLSLYKSSGLSKTGLLKAMSEYHTPQVAQTIKSASMSEDLNLSQTAQSLIDSFGDQRWYQDGLNVNLNSEGKGTKRDYESQLAQY